MLMMDKEYQAKEQEIWTVTETDLKEENVDGHNDLPISEAKEVRKRKKRLRRQLDQEQEHSKKKPEKTKQINTKDSIRDSDLARFDSGKAKFKSEKANSSVKPHMMQESGRKHVIQKKGVLTHKMDEVSHLLFSDEDDTEKSLEEQMMQSTLQFGKKETNAIRLQKQSKQKQSKKPESRWLQFESKLQQDPPKGKTANQTRFWIRRYQVKVQTVIRRKQPLRQIWEAVKGKFSKSGIAVGMGILFLLLVGISMFGTCSAVLSTGGGSVVASSYQASDEELLQTNEAYCKLERQLQQTINTIEQTHPGYDAYDYQVDEIEHNPYTLMSYLTVTNKGTFRAADVKTVLQALFNSQYELSVQERTRTQTRTVQKIREVTDPETGEIRQEVYTENEPYDQRALCVKLTNHKLENLVVGLMTDDEYLAYQIYQENYGNRSYLFGLISPGTQDFEVSKEALSDERFAAMIAEAEKYLGMAYVWGGSSPQTGFDCSGFVSWVINHSVGSVGRQTANGLYQMTARVSPQDAKPGDLIFFQKTYDTQGASHVGIYVGSGMMIHCGNPIQYVSINSPYYQEHFLGYGRLQ